MSMFFTDQLIEYIVQETNTVVMLNKSVLLARN